MARRSSTCCPPRPSSWTSRSATGPCSPPTRSPASRARTSPSPSPATAATSCSAATRRCTRTGGRSGTAAPCRRPSTGRSAPLPVSLKDMSPDFKARQFLRGARLHTDARHFGWVGSYLPHEIAALLRPEVRERALAEDPYAPVARELAAGPRREGLDRLLFLYARFYLADDVLVKVDRATMASSLEARSPFLDP